MTLQQTHLSEEHKKLGAKLAEFGGWLMPIQYDGIIAEHNWTRNSASIFDIGHMGEFIIKGNLKASGLDKIITTNLDKAKCGSCHYGFMTADDGGIIDDVIVYKIGEEEWMLVVNAATTAQDEEHIKRHLSKDSEFNNVSKNLAKIDLQGPLARDVLKKNASPDIETLKYYTFGHFDILGENSIISRTGYTGELGYEIYIENKKVNDLWNILLKDERVKPAGLGARDTLRLEMCLPLYGHDIDKNTTPLEAGFDRFVDFDKDFIGKDVLLRDRKKGITKKLTPFMSESRRAPRHGYKIIVNGENVGVVTSGSFSPSLFRGIGLGYVSFPESKTGNNIILKNSDIEIKAKISDRPFYKNGSVKK